jgi:hypothetical protein
MHNAPATAAPRSCRWAVVRAIGSSADLIVFIASLSIYTNGISFSTEARARGGLPRQAPTRGISLRGGLRG